MTKRPFADVAIAFANGKAIEYRANYSADAWCSWPHPWFPSFKEGGYYDYRIKPQKVWRWVVRTEDGAILVAADYFQSAEQVEKVSSTWHALQPILSTEKEL